MKKFFKKTTKINIIIFIITIIVVVFIFVSFSFKDNNKDNFKDNSKIDKVETFDKKIKCEPFIKDIKEKIEKENSFAIAVKACDTSWQGTSACSDSVTHKQFQEVFYSDKLNTCVYLETDTRFFKGDDPDHYGANPENSKIFSGVNFYINDEYYILYDLLNGSKIDEARTQWRNTPRELLTDLSISSSTDKYPGVVELMLIKYRNN
ncbi:MAG: hypothetical protein WCO35_01930 [Candidatus Nomurabacteria bacterium]